MTKLFCPNDDILALWHAAQVIIIKETQCCRYYDVVIAHCIMMQ